MSDRCDRARLVTLVLAATRQEQLLTEIHDRLYRIELCSLSGRELVEELEQREREIEKSAEPEKSPRLRAYLALETARKALDEMPTETEQWGDRDVLADERISDAMDQLWLLLTDAEHARLDSRGGGEPEGGEGPAE